MLRIGGDRQQGLGRGLEQQVINDSLVLVGDVGDGRRQCEHDMIIRHRQQIGLARASHSFAASPWHFGQCRLRQVMGDAH